MGIVDPAGYSEAATHVFTWLADKVLGGTKGGRTEVEARRAKMIEQGYVRRLLERLQSLQEKRAFSE